MLPVAMVNLLAGRRLVPELLNARFTPDGVVAALKPLLAEGAAREAQIAGWRRSGGAAPAPAGGRASAGSSRGCANFCTRAEGRRSENPPGASIRRSVASYVGDSCSVFTSPPRGICWYVDDASMDISSPLVCCQRWSHTAVGRARAAAAADHGLCDHRRPGPGDEQADGTAEVTFTALEDLTSATFELNNGLQITPLTDAAKKPLSS